MLLIDNELHKETVKYRLAKVRDARGVFNSEFARKLRVECLRVRLVDIHAMEKYFEHFRPGQFKVVISRQPISHAACGNR